MTAHSQISEQARHLSSGTVASLIRQNRYDLIDRTQHEFVSFIDRTGEAAHYATWQDAWAAFVHAG